MIFAAIDVGGGFKSAQEVGLELAKTAAVSLIGAGMGSVTKSLSGLTNNIGNTAGRILTNAAINAGASYVTNVANTAINSFYIGEDGLSFNTDNFTNSLFSKDSLANALGAGLSTGVTQGLNEYTLGANHIKANGLNSSQISSIQSLNSLAGGLSSSAASFALTGNATFNLLNIKGSGAFELTVGKDGMSGRLGTGGTDISVQTIAGAVSIIKNTKKNSWKT